MNARFAGFCTSAVLSSELTVLRPNAGSRVGRSTGCCAPAQAAPNAPAAARAKAAAARLT